MSQLRSLELGSTQRNPNFSIFEHSREFRGSVKAVGGISGVLILRLDPPELVAVFDKNSGLDLQNLTSHYLEEDAVEKHGKGGAYNILRDVFYDPSKARKAVSLAVSTEVQNELVV